MEISRTERLIGFKLCTVLMILYPIPVAPVLNGHLSVNPSFLSFIVLTTLFMLTVVHKVVVYKVNYCEGLVFK